MVMVNIGKNIKKLRENKGLNQTQLAKLMGCTPQTISSWEHNRTEPNMGAIESLSKILDCKKTDIIGEVQKTGHETEYYYNNDAREMAQFMFDNPEYRVLFDAARNVKKEDIEFVRQMIDRMTKNYED